MTEKSVSCLVKWIVEDFQPLSVLSSASFKSFVGSLEPGFKIPCDKTVKLKISDLASSYAEKLAKVLQGIQWISFTTDMWTSSSNSSCIGVTIHWLDSNFVPKSAMLEFCALPHPHTGLEIRNFLLESFHKWSIMTKVVSGVTDNGANMVAALGGMNGVSGFRCFAHSLQISVKAGLSKASQLISRVRKIVSFFNYSPKQMERLNHTQRMLSQSEKPVGVIVDCETRWNSTFYMFERLVRLERAIVQLELTLSYSDRADEKKDGEKLKNFLLDHEEWSDLKNVVKVLKPLELATSLVSGSSYATLSLIIPMTTTAIQKLQVVQETPVANAVRLGILEDMLKRPIVNREQVLRATLLDPRFKSLSFLDEKEREATFEAFKASAHEFKETGPDQDARSSKVARSKLDDFFSDCLESEDPGIHEEVRKYLSITEVPKTEINEPLIWWASNGQKFPKLAEMARQAFTTPASSCPSERLFSDAGNLLTSARSRLSLAVARDMLFVKKAMQLFD